VVGVSGNPVAVNSVGNAASVGLAGSAPVTAPGVAASTDASDVTAADASGNATATDVSGGDAVTNASADSGSHAHDAAAGDTLSATAVPSDAASTQMIHSNSAQFLHVCEKLEASLREERELEEAHAQGIALQQPVSAWMSRVQAVLYPRSEQEADVGRPLQSTDKNLPLPAVVTELHEAAVATGVDCVPDVRHAWSALRWCYWCVHALYMLRGAPSSCEVRYLYQQGRNLLPSPGTSVAAGSSGEEKLLKSLGAIVSRTSTWKTKMRKHLRASYRPAQTVEGVPIYGEYQLELPRANVLMTEAMTLPVRSRLRDVLKSHTLPLNQKHGVPAMPAGGAKKKEMNSQFAGIVVPIPALAVADSSDEEREGVVGPVKQTVIPASHLAPAPDDLWPPAISAPRTSPAQPVTTNATSTAAPTSAAPAPSTGIASHGSSNVLMNSMLQSFVQQKE